MEADEEIRLVVVRHGGPVFQRHRSRSSSLVSSTRMPSRASMAALMRRATASVRSFSLVPAAPFDAFVRAAMAGIDRDRLNGGLGRTERRRQVGPRGGPRNAGRSGSGFRGRRQYVDRQAHGRIDRQRRGAKSGDARPEVDAERRRVQHAHALNKALRSLRRERRDGDIERIRVELDREEVVVLLRDGAVGPRRGVERQAAAGRDEIVTDRHARHAEVADDQQMRRFAKLELGCRRSVPGPG